MLNFYWAYAALFFVAGLTAVYIMFPALTELIARAGFLRPNYRGHFIPAGAGLVFFFGNLWAAGIYFYLFQDTQSALGILFTVSAFTCLGLLDDVWGTRETSGLAGHFKSLLHGRCTTGACKALGGLAAAALTAAFLGSSRPFFLINTLAIALSANAVNLLDRRPGRAGKGFIFLTVILIFAGWGQQRMLFLITFLGAVLAYLKADLKEKVMMGDTGANSLGAVLGVGAFWALEEPYLIIYLLFLTLFHLLAEKYSLTRLIAKNRLLDCLDRLGRSR
ncbi:MAG: hypothetical protein AB1523_11830 [Bacillota bacterium]